MTGGGAALPRYVSPWRDPPARRKLRDANDGSARDQALEMGIESAGQLRQVDRARDDPIEVPRLEIRTDALPHREAQVSRRGHGIDAEEIHAPQNEGQDGGLEFGTGRQSDAGDIAAVTDRAREPAEEFPSDAVDAAGELRGFE